jgi:hypothetical protein
MSHKFLIAVSLCAAASAPAARGLESGQKPARLSHVLTPVRLGETVSCFGKKKSLMLGLLFPNKKNHKSVVFGRVVPSKKNCWHRLMRSDQRGPSRGELEPQPTCCLQQLLTICQIPVGRRNILSLVMDFKGHLYKTLFPSSPCPSRFTWMMSAFGRRSCSLSALSFLFLCSPTFCHVSALKPVESRCGVSIRPLQGFGQVLMQATRAPPKIDCKAAHPLRTRSFVKRCNAKMLALLWTWAASIYQIPLTPHSSSTSQR